ncbi:hypothetical protein [Natronospora cellulosivora (SeqCode)]
MNGGDQNAQKMFCDCCDQMDNIISSVEDRCNYIEQEEPQYKVKEQMQNQDNNQEQQ